MNEFEQMGIGRKKFTPGGQVASNPVDSGAGEIPEQAEPAREHLEYSLAQGSSNDVTPTQSDTGERKPAEFKQDANNAPLFTMVTVDDMEVDSFAKEYTSISRIVDCVADVDMLLSYMVSTERRLGVTLSLEAYGVDPIVFDQAAERGATDGEPAAVISIKVPGKTAGEVEYTGDLYELIEVDKKLYLSCVSESLNSDYLHQVISAATEAVMTIGSYVHTLVGPRPLNVRDDQPQTFIDTLKLNSYELSVLLSCMQKIPGVRVYHGVYDGYAAITFER